MENQTNCHWFLNLELTLRPPSPPPQFLQLSLCLSSPPPPPNPSPQLLHPPSPFDQSELSLHPPFSSPPPSLQCPLSPHLSGQPPPPPPEHLLSSQPPLEHPFSFHPLQESPPPSPAESPHSLPLPLQSPPLPPEGLQPLPTQQTRNESVEIPKPKRHRTKADTRRIEPPYPWSTEQRGVIHELKYLQANNILTIKGEVKCRRCERKDEIEYDLMSKFDEMRRFIEREKDNMHDRAPYCWINPILLKCKFCNKEKCVEPIISLEDDTEINWLFLLLGNFLGCLKLRQLKYFCAQTNTHRTGAKDRLVYLTYLALCKQLQPEDQIFD